MDCKFCNEKLNFVIKNVFLCPSCSKMFFYHNNEDIEVENEEDYNEEIFEKLHLVNIQDLNEEDFDGEDDDILDMQFDAPDLTYDDYMASRNQTNNDLNSITSLDDSDKKDLNLVGSTQDISLTEVIKSMNLGCPVCSGHNFKDLGYNRFKCLTCNHKLDFGFEIRSIKGEENTYQVCCPDCKGDKFKALNSNRFKCLSCKKIIKFCNKI